MRIRISVCAVLVAGVVAVLPGGAQNPDSPLKSIEISATKYEFTPSEIRVKAGEHVRLTAHSVDQTHGVKLTLYPEGSKDKTIVGLKFDHPEDNGKVEKNVDQVLDFLAEKPGTYEFQCAKVCGIHHAKMKGQMIVEE